MTVFARAPMRIDFAGGWTDVPEYAAANGGTVVNAAIGRFARAELILGGGKIKLLAEDLDERETIASSARLAYDGALALHKAALNMLPVTGGIEIITGSDAPPGSGLGGSAALSVALLAGLARSRHESYGPEELAEFAFALESVELGLQGGRQDQYAAALGGFHQLEFADGTPGVERLAVTPEAAGDLERHLVLVYSGQSHFSSQTHDRVWRAHRAGDSAVAGALHAIRDAARAAASAVPAGDWRRLAEAVDENWRNQQQLDVTISTEATMHIERAAREVGAWGLKATGAGAGGCLVILCAADRRERVIAAATAKGGRALPCHFSFEGVEVWEGDDAARQR